MKIVKLILLASFALSFSAAAEVEPAAIRAPETTAWIGQRLPFFVDLRSKGSFSGTASFDLPQIPGALVVKIGDPVVDTQEFDDKEWFIQRHEFALFSQTSGELTIPSFSVRFTRRDGFSGPASDVQTKTSKLALQIKRPPGSEQIGFLMTTDSLEIKETWDPEPGPAEIGTIFKRTITQHAEQLPGMALAPTPTEGPDGIRIYPGTVETKDNFYRGAFVGERSETITYLLQKPGSLTVPGLTYTWWNPEKKELQSKTLPAVTFEVPVPPESATKAQSKSNSFFWLKLVVIALIIGLVIWKRHAIATWGKQTWRKLNPPDRIAARKLLQACGNHDAASAEAAWTVWRNTQGPEFQPNKELQAAVLEMQRTLFGPASENSWQGDTLSRVFSESLSARKSHSSHKSDSTLPLLNPRS